MLEPIIGRFDLVLVSPLHVCFLDAKSVSMIFKAPAPFAGRDIPTGMFIAGRWEDHVRLARLAHKSEL